MNQGDRSHGRQDIRRLRPSHRRFACLLAVLCRLPQTRKEQPVGLVLSAPGAKVLRANTETPLAARVGDILFSGDALRTEAAPASFPFLPGEIVGEPGRPTAKFIFDAAKLKVKSGKIADPSR